MMFTLQLENVDGAEKLTLTEGENGVTMTIYATAPPYVLCRDINLSNADRCEIQVVVEIAASASEIHCPDGMVIEQASVRITEDGQEKSLCRISVTSDKWTSRFDINVRANIDNKYDADTTRQLTLTKQFLVDAAVKNSVTILQSEAGFFLLVPLGTPKVNY